MAATADADARRQGLADWLATVVEGPCEALTAVSGDASFRRYFRVRSGGRSWIAMDAPPAKESSAEFVALARQLRELGLQVPEVVAADLELGYLLLSDLGSEHYLDALTATNADRLYGAALDALERLQVGGVALAAELPAYDQALLRRELELFPEWLLERHLGLELDAARRGVLEAAFARLIEAALAQPRVAVHRDYHSRNLMVLANGPGVLDFQDAVAGPVTYDLVSLLRDCYIAWPRAEVERWALAYLQRPAIRRLAGNPAPNDWLRAFDLMGMQRHLKASGIFARLQHRDGKSGYLQDIPRTVGYLAEVSGRYPAFADFHRLLVDAVLPRLQAGPGA